MHSRFSMLWSVLLALLPAVAPAADPPKPAKPAQPQLGGVGGAAGIGVYPPASWGVVGATVTNPTDAEQELLLTFQFDEAPTLQYAMETWLPPKTRRMSWIPMRSPTFEINPDAVGTLKIRQRLLDVSSGEPLQLGEGEGTLIKARDHWITGVLADEFEADDEGIATGVAMRMAQDLSQRMAYLRDDSMPTLVAGWQGLNSLMICADRPKLDSAQLAALRQWLLSGGKLWVMMDQVEPAFMAALLGDAWTGQMVDRVDLTHIQFDPPATSPGQAPQFKTIITINDASQVAIDGNVVATIAPAPGPRQKALDQVSAAVKRIADKADAGPIQLRISGAVTGQTALDIEQAVRAGMGTSSPHAAARLAVERQHERPVPMARLLAPGMEVVHTVSGWPATLRQPVGKGWLLVTTVGARGWVEPVLLPAFETPGREPAPDAIKTREGHKAVHALEELSAWLHRDHRAAKLPPQAFEPFLREQIGYEIVHRSTVAMLLGLFTLALVAAGAVLARSGRLEHLAWVGAVIAGGAALLLIFVGHLNRQSTPATVADGQFIQVAPDQQHVVVSGTLMVYNPGQLAAQGGAAAGEARFGATAGGLILPADLSLLASRNVRMVWTDLDQWHWERVSMAAGATTAATFEQTTPLNKPVHARLSFDEQGITGTLETGPLGAMSDLLLATPGGAVALTSGAEGRFRGAMIDVLDRGQFTRGGVIDDQQRRRQDLLRRLLGDAESKDDALASTRPTVGAPVLESYRGRSRLPLFPEEPTLLGWAAPMPLGFEMPKVKQRVGEALVAVPIEWEPVAPGTKVAVPSPLVPFSVVRSRDGRISPVFDAASRRWSAISTPAPVRVRFELPRAVLPLKLDSAVLKLDIHAPGRPLELLAERGERTTSLLKRNSFSGVIELPIPADATAADAQGFIYVNINVGEMSQGERSLWQIRDVGLSVTGVVGN